MLKSASRGGVSAPGGCLVRGCVSGPGVCVWSGGSLLPGGCLVQEGGWVGAWSGGGVYPSMYWGRHPSPPVDRQTPVKILPWPNFVAAGKNVLTDNHYEAIYGPVRSECFSCRVSSESPDTFIFLQWIEQIFEFFDNEQSSQQKISD